MHIELWVTLFAVASGLLFGLAAQSTHFCALGAVSDIVLMRDWTRMRMWLLAMAIAMAGVWIMRQMGWVGVHTVYSVTPLKWVSHLVGGGVFGIGMVLASGCGGKTVLRLGAGSLKAIVVFLVTGAAAYATMNGILAPARLALDQFVITPPDNGILPGSVAPYLSAVILLAALSAYRTLPLQAMLGGTGVGLAVVLGWFASGFVGYLPEDPATLQEGFLLARSGKMESLTFVAPMAHWLEGVMFWSPASPKVSLGMYMILGVFLGGWLVSMARRQFRWEGFCGIADTRDHLAGAGLMGFGGVVAMGCTVGQGISGVSVLSVGAWISVSAIVAGAVLVLKFKEWLVLKGS